MLTLNVFAPTALAQNAPPAPADKSEQQRPPTPRWPICCKTTKRARHSSTT
ncbi:hypothetical protein M8494_18120 [Serratia ureilytica]